MDSVIRGAVIYVFLFILLRCNGKRTIGEVDTFDFILLLIISEATQQALMGEDFSITNAILVIVTLVSLETLFSHMGYWVPRLRRALNDVPIVLVEHGKVIKRHLDKERIDEDSILEQARTLHGLERMDQIKYAVLERNGEISIIPTEQSGS
jgi:uncharacterized membrane protein YcaP (DUF421 family)